MIKYIYIHMFKPKAKQLYNSNSILDTSDIELLDSIWNIYTSLCYKYRKRPTLLNFSILVGIGNDVFNSWIRGEYRNTTTSHCQTAKRWKAECEGALIDGAIDNNSIGCIFALKACYGYAETAPTQQTIIDSKPQMSAQEIAARHQGAQLPEKPVFDMED